MFTLISLPLQGLHLLETNASTDERGSFSRIFCQETLQKSGLTFTLAQANISLTATKGAIRGMHFQYPPYAEIKIVRCISGSCFDVVIDVRKNSPSFLHWHGEILTPENRKALYISEGFAHGFQTLEAHTSLLYLHSKNYTQQHEGALRYNDPRIGIKWPCDFTDISQRDQQHALLDETFEGLFV